MVQPEGSVSVNVVSTLVGPYEPLLCTEALPVTLNAVLTGALAGLFAVTLVTLMSEMARTLVVAPLPTFVLLVEVGSETCNWSTAAVVVTEKLCAEGLLQVTDQLTGLAGTVVAVEVARDVSCTVCGLPEEVVQSVGRLSVKVVSTLVGP